MSKTRKPEGEREVGSGASEGVEGADSAEFQSRAGARDGEDLDDADLLSFGDCPPDRETRVRAIMHLMATGRWERGMAVVIASAWNLAVNTVESYSSEASRRVTSLGEEAFVKERLVVALDEALDGARGDPKAMATVATAFAPIAGVTKTSNVQVFITKQHDALFDRLKAVLPPEWYIVALEAAESLTSAPPVNATVVESREVLALSEPTDS